MPRRQRTRRLALVSVAAFVGLLAGGSLWLDQHGVLASARVTAKHERILVRQQPTGEWDRYYEVTAALPDGEAVATVRVSADRYAALRVGDSLGVRYLQQFPLLARTSDRSTAGIVRDMVWAFAGIPLVGWIAAGSVGLWIVARLGVLPVLAAGAAWGAAGWVLFFTPPQRDQLRPAQAMAEVQRITLVDRAPHRAHNVRRSAFPFDRRLDIPYEVVELLLPDQGGDAVLAVDAVDSGSVKGLAPNARVAVRLDPVAPRDAQLVGGTRRFVAANRYHLFVLLFGVVLLGTLVAVTSAWRRSRRTTGHPDRMSHRGGQNTPHDGGA